MDPKRVIIVGGGVAGLRAAMDLASLGVASVLLEKEDTPAGCLARLKRWFTDDACGLCRMMDMDRGRSVQESCLRQSFEHPLVEFRTGTRAVDGSITGDRAILTVTRMIDGATAEETIEGDAVIVAGGFDEAPVDRLSAFGHGRIPGVVTALEIEEHLSRSPTGPLLRPGDSRPVERAVLLACIGSRDDERPYCSSACCSYIAKIALLLREANPSLDLSVLMMDRRFHGKGHEIYGRKALAGARVLQGRAAAVERDGDRLIVKGVDGQGPLEIAADLAVLSGGQAPAASELLKKLGVEIDPFGYPAPWPGLELWRTNVDRVFTAGASRAPCDIPQAVMEARAAALNAAWILGAKASEPKRLLVVGGGPAGMSSALWLSRMGHRVVLAEERSMLGGEALRVGGDPAGRDLRSEIQKMIQKIESSESIDLRLGTKVAKLRGGPIRFSAVLEKDGETPERMTGLSGVIAAVGAAVHRPKGLIDKRVVTLHEAEEIFFGQMNASVLIRAAPGGGAPKAWRGTSPQAGPIEDSTRTSVIVFRQCAETRNAERPWCNRTCCLSALRLALKVKTERPDAAVWILHRDIMAPGMAEMLYCAAREAGVLFGRFEEDREPVIEEDEAGLRVRFFDAVLERDMILRPGLVVLSSGVESPRERLADLDIPSDETGFGAENETKFRPERSIRHGVLLAGSARSPVPVADAVLQGAAAAAGASVLAELDAGRKDPRPSSATRPSLCAGCGLCVESCPAGARMLEGLPGKAVVIEALCQACGLCASVCPAGAAVISQQPSPPSPLPISGEGGSRADEPDRGDRADALDKGW